MREYLRFVFAMVIPLGFEPKTYCLEGSCSNPTELRNHCEKRCKITAFYCYLQIKWKKLSV